MMRALGLLAGRYLLSKRRERFITAIGAIAVLGVALGVAALITVIAVMTGFDQDLQSKIIGANAHLTVQADGPMRDADAVIARLAQVPGITAASPFVQGQALAEFGTASTGIVVRGIDPARERHVTDLAKYLVRGTLDPGPEGILLGKVLAQRLGVRPGESVRLVTQANQQPRSLTVTGLFACGMYDYDANLALTRLATAQSLLGLSQTVTGVGARVEDPLHAGRVQATVRRTLGYPY